MNHKILFLIAILYSIGFCVPRVLIIVHHDYYANSPTSSEKVNRYVAAVNLYDGYVAERVLYPDVFGGSGVEAVWNYLANRYDADKNIEGAVLIGDIPIPVVYNDYASDSQTLLPVDQLYMDISFNGVKYDAFCNISATVEPGTITVPNHYVCGLRRDGNYYLKDFSYGQPFPASVIGYKGDNINEIWISRIYTKNLTMVRNQGGVWGVSGSLIFKKEYTIIDEYLDRVNNRMTNNANVPPRAFFIGGAFSRDPTQDQSQNPFSDFFDMIRYYGSDGPTKKFTYIPVPDQDRPEKYQAILQAGPYGNVSSGAALGVCFNESCNNTDSRYRTNDTRGFEWACLLEHSNMFAHAFNSGHEGPLAYHGTFNTANVSRLWDFSSSGGYLNSSYYSTKEDDYVDPLLVQNMKNPGNYPARFKLANPQPGNYRFSLYIPNGFTTAQLNRFYYHIKIWNGNNYNDNSLKIPRIEDEQRLGTFTIGTDRWAPLNNGNTFSLTDFTPVALDSLSFEIHPIFYQYNSNPIKFVFATTIRAENITTGTVSYITYTASANNPQLNRNLPQTINMKRSFTSFLDDGGSSKTHFFLMNCCQPSNFLYANCLGSIYAFTQNGLVSLGKVTACYGTDYQPFQNRIKQGMSLGKAFLNYINTEYTFERNRVREPFAFLGAGTLKGVPYKPYKDSPSATMTNYTLSNIDECNYYGDYFQMNNTTVTNTGVFEVAAGNYIRILPNTTFANGSYVCLKVDPSLR